MIIGFKIYYGNGSIYSSKDGSWKDAPAEDIQVVLAYEDRTYKCWYPDEKVWKTHNYRKILHEMDYYWLDENSEPQMGNAKDLPDPAPNFIKLGKWTDSETFKEIINKAYQDLTWEE